MVINKDNWRWQNIFVKKSRNHSWCWIFTIKFGNLFILIFAATNTPTIATCLTRAIAGDKTEVLSNTGLGSSACLLQSDMHGRFQVKYLSFDINAFFHVDIDKNLPKPKFVEGYLFGITDVDVQLKKISVAGKTIRWM